MKHVRGHQYERGGCITCGYHCVTCPVGTARCKCSPIDPPPPHAFPCSVKWCRICWDANFGKHQQYPVSRYIRSGEKWKTVTIHCGPGAFRPYRPTHHEAEAMRMTCPHEQMDLTCDTCLRHIFHPLEIG